MNEREILAALDAQLTAARAAHCRRVAETAEALARRHGLPADQARLAGLLHDWYRELPEAETLRLGAELGLFAPADRPQVVSSVLHGPIAARLLPRRWPALAPEVLTAIDRHTTGDPAMTDFDCAVYLGDLLEPGHAGTELDALRALAASDLRAAMAAALDAGLRHLLERGRPIDLRTVATRNALLRGRGPRGTAPGLG